MFLGWNKTKENDKTVVHFSPSTLGIKYNKTTHCIFEWVLSVVVLKKLRAPQNGWFFIHFVTFNTNLVYSVVWKHSSVLCAIRIIGVYIHQLHHIIVPSLLYNRDSPIWKGEVGVLVCVESFQTFFMDWLKVCLICVRLHT